MSQKDNDGDRERRALYSRESSRPVVICTDSGHRSIVVLSESTTRGIDGDQLGSVCRRHRSSVKGKLDVFGIGQAIHTMLSLIPSYNPYSCTSCKGVSRTRIIVLGRVESRCEVKLRPTSSVLPR